MIWTAWRQQRSVAVAMSVVAIAFLGYLLYSGFHQQALWTQYLARPCRGDLNTPVRYQTYCSGLLDTVQNSGHFNRFIVNVGIILGPLFGSILGVSSVTREVEQRTTRLVWTQSGTRSQWLASKYLVNIAIIVTIFGPMFLMLGWWNRAAHYGARIAPSSFPIAGFLLLLYSIVAFTAVVTLGLFIRRAGWTFAVGLIFAGLVIFGMEFGVRPLLVSPTFVVVSSSEITQGSTSGFYASGGAPSNSWGRGGGYAPVGTTVTPSTQSLDAYSTKFYGCLNTPRGHEKTGYTYCSNRLNLEYVGIFVPDSEFWRLQFEEGSIYLGIAILLSATSYLRVRRMLA